MATAGLSLTDQFSTERFLGQPPDPFGPTPMASSGLGGLGPSSTDMAVLGEALVRGSAPPALPQMRQPPTIAFSPSSNKVFVQGTVFDADDAAQAVQSEQLLSAPGTGLPSAGDWVPLDAQAYGQYLESIRNPGLWRLAKKNFGRGVDVMQMLAGRGMQLAGAEETGGRIVSAQMEDLRKTAPFERMFTDIESGRGAVEWFVANLAQQGPNLIESVATALAGFAAGSAVGTPLAGPGAALAALAGKETFKQSVLAAARKKAAGQTLDAAENKLLREAAGLAGATAASFAQNISTGAADIYGELRDQGANADDVSARMTALAGSIPYAALETLPEFLLAGRVLGNVRAPRAIAPGTPLPRRAGELLRRGAVGGAIGGTLEGTTEAGQEALLLGLSDQDLTSPEGMNRLINSFAAGFGVGGPIGAIANLRGRQPANLLESGKATEPPAGGALAVVPPPPPTPPGTALAPYYTPVGPATPTVTPPAQLAGPPTVPLLAGPTPPVSPVGGPIMMVTPEGQAYMDQMLRQTGNIPPGAPGTQGVLDVFGGTISAQELATRMQPPAVAAPAAAPEALALQPGQGALQFAPAAPEAPAPTALGNALQRAVRRQQEAQMQQQREAELAAQREAELERLAGVAGRQRQLDLIEPERPALPMVPAEARPPRQLPLFPRGALPGPTRRQRAAAAAPLAQVPPGARRLRRQRAQAPQEQLRLPYIATDVTPEIARATWNDKRPASVRKWEALSEEAQQKWTDAIIAAKATPALRAQISREETQARLKPKEKPSAAQEGKLKQGRVAERAKGDEGVGAGRDTGQKPTAQVPAGGAEAGGRGVTLKRGKKAPVVDITQRRAEQIEEEDARREAEEDRAVREKIQADLKERHTKRLQELVRTIRDGRKVLNETDYPGSLEAKELQRLLNGFQDYIDRFNELVSPDNTDNIQQTQADTFDRLMADELSRELESVKKLSEELTKPLKTRAREARTAKLLKAGETVEAGRQWGQYADPKTQPKWADLTDAQKEAWRKVVIDDRKPSIAAAEEIAPPKKEPPSPKAEAARAAAPDYLAPGEFVYHAVRSDEDVQGILDNGLRVGANVSFGTSGQAFSGEGATILVFRREDVSSRGKGYQNDGVTTKAAKPVAILKDTSLEADRPTRGELEEQGTAAYEEEQRLAEYAKREYGLTDEDILQYSVGARKIKDAPTEAQPILKRILVQSKLSARLLDQADTAPETAVTAAQVLGRYSRYNLPVQEVRIEVTDDTQTVTATDTKPEAAPETAEERWSGMEDMPFTDLPAELQARWRDAVAKGTATGELAAQLADDARAEAEVEVAPADDLGEATRAVEEAVSDQVTPEIRQALALISEYAFFTPEDTNTVAFVERARAWLGNTTLSEAQRRVLDEVVLAQVNERSRVEAAYTRGTNKGTDKPWFSYAKSRGMLFNVRSTVTGLPVDAARVLVQAGKLKLSNLPADTQRKLGSVETPATVGSAPAKTTESSTVYRSVRTPQALLGDLIDSLISRVREMTNLNQKVRIRGVDYTSLADAARTLYAQTTAEGRKYIVRGYPLSEYFTADGEPKIVKSAGRFIIGTKTLSAAEQAKIEKEQREEARALAQQRAEAALDPAQRTYDQYDSSDGAAFRDDGTPITKNVPPGRVRLLVTAFLSKLRRKPTVHVYANVEDLKKRNPELYRRAAASRSKGDFDTINAVGYSFGSPEAVPRMSRRMFLRAAGAGISALKLPPLSKETQLRALRSAWEMTFNTYNRWQDSIMTGAIGRALDNVDFNVEMLYGYANNRAVRDFLYRSEYADYAGDAYDYALVDLLDQEGPAALVDLQQAMQAQRAAMLDQLKQASSEKKATKDSYPGAHVIIFTDFVRTEQQLRFVLAHETIGHFGLRAVIPRDQLDAALNRVFDADLDVQAAVEAMMSVQGMSKLEAIEEYVADNAAILDSSLIMQLWNLLKNFLNKLGLKFQDDEARYLINLSRKYVRRGEDGNFVNATAVADDMRMMEQDRDDGRFARVGFGDALERGFAVNSSNNRFGGSGGLLGAMDAFVKGAYGKRQDVPGTVARLLEQVQTLSNKARRSFGLSEVYRLLENQQQYARQLLSKYQRMTTLTHTPTFFGYGGGVTEEEKLQAGELLAHAALLKSKQATDELIQSFGNLVSIDAMGNIDVDTAVRDAIEKAGFVTAEEFRKGFDIEYDDGKGNISKVRFQRDIDENSNVWKIYNEQRKTVNEAAIDLMLANFEASQAESKRVIGDLNNKRRGANKFSQEDLATIRRVAEMYQNTRLEGSDIASASVSLKKAADQESEAFLVAFGRALFNDDVYAVWMKDPAAKPDIVADLAEFQKAEYDDIRAQLPSLRAKVKSDKQSFVVQKAIRDIFLFNLQAQNADYYAKRTILGSYVPFTRRGTEQVRLAAYDSRGNPVALSENVRAVLPYFQFESRSEANAAAQELESTFGGDNEWVLLDEDGAEVTVRLRPEVSRTRQSPDLSEAVNFNEFIYVLNRLNINLTPQARERVITTLTNQNNRARKNLQRSGTPGWDQDVVRSVSEHLETSAHVSAKKLYRNRLDDILLNNRNWFGDPERLDALQQAVDNAATDGERARAQREYDRYAYMYQYMAASAGKETVKIAGQDKPTLGRGEDYKEYAKEVLRWYSSATNISDSTEDMLSGETGSRLKLVTVLMQLGGSVASAALNMISLPTHSLPYLSFYNQKTGIGGGYGSAKASTALWKALRDLKNPKLSEAADLETILRDGTWDQFGMTQDEAEFLFDQTEQGTLQAAQFNALVGTARGKVFSNKAQAAVRLWMGMFSYTEQLNRRATSLAAYRLEKERALAQGIPEEQAIAEAIDAARTAVNTAQGEYAMFNRPAMARGNILQYLFVYKQFTILTVELLRNMPLKGQLMMLGFLLLLSGLKGLPFAEDLMDIVDTIAQMLGLKMASIEKELATWIDDVAPGMTPIVMKGVLDRMTGATISTRVGMGDLIPLTGAFRAGASPTQELQDFAGPVFGGISGLVGTSASLTQYGAEVLGLRDDTTSLNGILRNAPVAAVRAIADGFTYWADGRITNARGQVVSADVGTLTILSRMMGFYPAIATEQNDIVRLSKYVAEYSKAIKADYVQAYVKAQLDGNTERMAQIRADVAAWNESAKGTGLEVTQFVRSANRAANEAQRPTVLRYLKSAPKNVRPETLEMLELNGIDPQELRQP